MYRSIADIVRWGLLDANLIDVFVEHITFEHLLCTFMANVMTNGSTFPCVF